MTGTSIFIFKKWLPGDILENDVLRYCTTTPGGQSAETSGMITMPKLSAECWDIRGM